MKALLLSSILLLMTGKISAATPVLLFSDIESGPKTGWSDGEPNKGAAVTVWGKGFGESRNSSYITVNGARLTASIDYAAWGENWPTEHYQKITFWLNDTAADGQGSITVTVDGLESNALPFKIRTGKIRFISTANTGGDGSLTSPLEVSTSNYNWIRNMVPGDLYYFRDTEVYEGEFNGGNSVIWIRDSEPSGTEALPIALLAYPGEKPTFSVPTYSVNHNNAIRFSNNHMVFAGFTIDAEWMGASLAGDFHRFIGNDVVGLKNYHGSGTGIVITGDLNRHTGDGSALLGNAIHGGNSQNRYDHGIYLSGCADNGGAKVGWNHFFDNDFGRGPIISINHQDNRCEVGQVLDAHFIFSNIVDCSRQRATGINVYDLSYDTGEQAPEPTYVYNNVFINCGTFDAVDQNHVGYAPAVIHNAAGSARFYHNTLYNTGYAGFRVRNNVTNTHFKNNIIHMSDDFPSPTGNHYTSIDNESAVSLSNNLYMGLGAYTTCGGCAQDQNNISDADPEFFDPTNKKFQVTQNSPAIGAGTINLLFEVSPPAYALVELDPYYVPRSAPSTIGAYEIEEIFVSTEETIELSSTLLYPNPGRSEITLQLELASQATVSLQLYDLAGKVVLSKEATDCPFGKTQIQLDVKNLSSGSYLVLVSIDGQVTETRTVVIE